MRKSFVLHRGAAWRLAAACGVCPLVLAAADVSAQTMTVAFGLRETGVDPGQVGGNGGATGGIEWIGLADNKVLTLDGSWQQFTFNFGGPNASSIAAFAGATANGMYDGIWGTIENLRINNSSAITNTVRLHIDDIVNTVGGTPTVVSGFEAGDPFPATVGTEHVFQEPRFSGSTQSFLVPTSSSLVTDQAAHSGTQSDEMIFTVNGTGGNTAWARITTFNTPNQGNPAINFAEGNSLSFWLRAEILPPDQRWIAPGSGNWDDPNNWGTGVVPNGTLSVANFLGDATSAATVTLNNPITINTVRLNNANTFTFVGPNTLTFTGAAQDARNISVEMGSHVFSAPITVNMGAGTSALMDFTVARPQAALTVNRRFAGASTKARTTTL